MPTAALVQMMFGWQDGAAAPAAPTPAPVSVGGGRGQRRVPRTILRPEIVITGAVQLVFATLLEGRFKLRLSTIVAGRKNIQLVIMLAAHTIITFALLYRNLSLIRLSAALHGSVGTKLATTIRELDNVHLRTESLNEARAKLVRLIRTILEVL